MRTSNANFDAQRTKQNKKFVYLVEIEGVSDKFVTLEHPSIDAKPLLSPPGSTSQSVTPEEGTGKISSLTVSLLDRNLAITSIVSGASLRGKTLTLKVGYKEIAEADFLTFWVGTIQDIKLSPDMLSYNIDARDPLVFGNETIFEPRKAKLNGAIGAGDSTISVDDASSFPDPATFTFQTRFFAAIKTGQDFEIFSYSGISGDDFTGSIRGELGTTAIAHNDGDVIEEVVVFKSGGLNPIDAYLQILFSSGTPGTNGVYDVLPQHWGLNLDTSLFDVSGIETARDNNVASLSVEFRLRGRENAGKFISNEFFKNLGAYPIILGDGKLSIKFFERPIPDPTLQPFTESNIRRVSSYELNLDRTYNNLLWEFDWDPITKFYDTTLAQQDPDSISKFEEQQQRKYSSKGIRSSLGGSTFITDRSGFIFFRFGTPPPTFRISCHMTEMLVETGDLVFFTHPLPPNIKTGERGFRSAIMEVIDSRIDWDQSRVDLTIQFVTLSTEFFLWGPETLSDAATEFANNPSNFEKYGFWSSETPGIVNDTQPPDLWG